MPTNLETIGELLTSEGMKYQLDSTKDRIETGFRLDGYRDPQGQPLLGILIGVEENGDFLRLVAPFCYLCRSAENYPAVLHACNHSARMFKMVRFELDPNDGEVRAEVQLPLEDAVLTQRQLSRILRLFPQILENVDLMFRDAVENGRFVPAEDPEELRRAFLEFVRQRRQAPTPIGLAE